MMQLFYIPYPDTRTAKQHAHRLLQEKLVVCCQISQPVISIYEWQGENEETEEVILWLKTFDEKKAQLESWIEKNHPYDTPCIAKITAEVNGAYYKWMQNIL